MKYEIKGKYVQALAESMEENVMLLGLNKEEVKLKGTYAVKRTYSHNKSKEARIEKKRLLGLLKEQLRQIPIGSKGFITSDMAKASKDFPSFAFHYGKSEMGVRIGTHKVYGGYEVAVK